MARLLGSSRLLWLLTKRDLKTVSSLGLNNLFFCAAFLMQGSNTPRAAVLSAMPFLLVLGVPLVVVLCLDTLTRIPSVRARLLPLRVGEIFALRGLASILNPTFWLFGGLVTASLGLAVGGAFVVLLAVMQLLVMVMAEAVRRLPSFSGRWRLPAPRSTMGLLVTLNLRLLLRSLDLWTAVLLSVAGTLYRFRSSAPKSEAYPILAVLIAIAMSTYAQRSFGLDSAGSRVRYRLLPLAGVKILLAKDIAYLAVVAILALPLGLAVAMTFSLVAISVGRIPSLRQNVPQRMWRFTGGDARYGVAQVLLGGLMAMATVRVSTWFVVPCVIAYAGSLFWGDRIWQQRYA